jgi:hypothetical protein
LTFDLTTSLHLREGDIEQHIYSASISPLPEVQAVPR